MLDNANALLDAIYSVAMDPVRWPELHKEILQSCREDRLDGKSSAFNRTILDHVQRALKLGLAKQRLTLERQRLADVVDQVAPPAFILSMDGRVLSMNSAAQALIQTANGVELNDNRLSLPGVVDLDPLYEKAQLEFFAVISLPDNSGLVQVSRLPDNTDCLSVIFQNQQILDRTIEDVSKQHAFSAKHVSILTHILHQRSTDLIQGLEKISYHTLNQHLKTIYRAMGVNSQAEVLSALLHHSLMLHVSLARNKHKLPSIEGLALSRHVTLKGGYKLCYTLLGEPTGIPVVYFSAMHGSRLELLMLNEQLRELGICLIGIDRPGFGMSDAIDYAHYSDYADIIQQLLNYLQLENVYVLCRSAGTPYGLACAAQLSDRILKVIVVGAMVPVDLLLTASNTYRGAILNYLFRIAPELMHPTLELMLRGLNAEAIFRIMTEKNSTMYPQTPKDIEYISDPQRAEYFRLCAFEAVRQGTEPWLQATLRLNQDWCIALEDIRCPVHFWHGQEDSLVPGALVSIYAQRFFDSCVTYVEEETHLLLFRQLRQIVQQSIN